MLHGRPTVTVMRRLLIRSKRRVLIASDYLERALAPGRPSTRQSRPDATDRERFATARSCSRGGFKKPERAFRFLPCGHGEQAANRSRSIANGPETCRVDTALEKAYDRVPRQEVWGCAREKLGSA